MIWLCKHKWKIIESQEVYRSNGEKRGFFYVLQCENCGKIKPKEVSI